MGTFEITYERTTLVKVLVEADSEEAALKRYEAADFRAAEIFKSTSRITEQNLLTIKETE